MIFYKVSVYSNNSSLNVCMYYYYYYYLARAKSTENEEVRFIKGKELKVTQIG